MSSFSSEGLLAGMQSSDWSVSIGRDKSGLEIQRELSGGVSVTTGRDMLGRVVRRDILSGGVEQSRMRYHWGMGNRLHRKVNERTGETVLFDYDRWDNLFRADYKGGSEVESIYKAPDALGNLFRTPERKDRKYGKGGRLLEDRKYSYHYDGEGNLVLKQRLRPDETLAPLWQEGDWAYEWQGNGMLRSVKRPDGETVSFEYDPLGRRISKTYKNKTTRWVWDGNVPLHEWTEEEKKVTEQTEDGRGESLITWLFEEGSFVPCAKLQNGESYSIVTDYLGTPTHAFDSKGNKVWERNLDIYGKIRTGNSTFVPFLYQGQYFDAEIDLCYNRYRYYDPSTGAYISQDPIGLNGGDRLYAFVHDPNGWVDVFGLAKRGPKTGGVGPHNEAIKAWGDEVIADGGTIIHGGGYEKEKLFETPGGHKSARRPDIIWKDADGKVHWGNVGKTNAVGKPVKREILAMQDLNKIRHANGVLDRVHFRSYNYPETNKKTKKPKSSCH